MIKTKRVYETIDEEDGYRILVDRLWPRGLSKETAHIDLWLKEVAPSSTLRKWFGHDTKKWEAFRRKYRDELKSNAAVVNQLRGLAKEIPTITLVYGAKDEMHNQAIVLKEFLSDTR